MPAVAAAGPRLRRPATRPGPTTARPPPSSATWPPAARPARSGAPLPGTDWPALVAHAVAATVAGGRGALVVRARRQGRRPGRRRADRGARSRPARRAHRGRRPGARATATSWPSPAAGDGSSSAPARRRSPRCTTSGWWRSGTTATTCTPSRGRPTPTPARRCCCAPSERGRPRWSAASRRTVEAEQLVRTGLGARARRRLARTLRSRVTVSVAGRRRARAGPRPAGPDHPDAHARCTDAIRDALADGPVLVQTPRAGYAAALACERCRTPARCRVCSGPLALGSATRRRRPAAGAARSHDGWACPECGHRGLRAPVVGEARTAEELGRTFAGTRGPHLRAATGCWPPSTTSRRSWSRRRAPSRWPRAATPPSCCSTPGWRSARPDLRAEEEALRRWCNAVGAGPPGWPGGRRSATRPTRRCRRWCAGTRPASPPARPPSGAEAHLPPASRLATITGEPGAVDDALTLLAPPAGVRGARPGARSATASRGSSSACRGPTAPSLSRALGEVQRVRSARKLDAVRIQVDPPTL